MNRTCIAVVDASRARLFTYERSNDVEGTKERFIEQRDLVNPSRRLRSSELFSDSRPGSSRTGGLQYGLDDHRDAHIDAIDAEFSRLVIEQLVELLRSEHAHRVVLCASPRMLGELRERKDELQREAVQIEELDRDLVKLTPAQLREHLSSYGLLPKPSRGPG